MRLSTPRQQSRLFLYGNQQAPQTQRTNHRLQVPPPAGVHLRSGTRTGRCGPARIHDGPLASAIALAVAAAHTRTVRLGTGIIILPQRNPVVLAKELASVDVLSNGRLIFGIGIGYLQPEFAAIGAPFDHKGPRTEDFLAAIIA